MPGGIIHELSWRKESGVYMRERIIELLNAVYTWGLQHVCTHTGYFVRERRPPRFGYRCLRCGVWRAAPWDMEGRPE